MRPIRLDHPQKITLSLSKRCHEQAADLRADLEREPGRRQAASFSEIVERAVAHAHARRRLDPPTTPAPSAAATTQRQPRRPATATTAPAFAAR